MNILSKYKDRLRDLSAKNFSITAILCIIFLVFLVSGLHEQYPDEYDSLLGGKRILEGGIQYRDWFQHHQPGAYVLAAVILSVTGEHFLRFRLVLESVYFLVFLLTYLYVSRRFENKNTQWFLVFWGIYGLLLTFFWGQMLLADTLAAVLFMPAVTLLTVLTWRKQRPDGWDMAVIGASLFLTWFTSMTFIYAVAALTLLAAYLASSGHKDNFLRRYFLKYLFLLSIPYLVFFAFYLAIGALGEWWFANVYYNQNYYIYNYPRPVGTPVNPLRYSVVIANQFFNNFSYALYSVTAFSLAAPLNAGLSLFAFAYLYVLISKRQFMFAAAVCITLIFATARNNPNDLRNTDYQSSVYIMITLLFGFLAFSEIRERFNLQKAEPFLKSADMVISLLVAVYLLAVGSFAWNEFRGKMYPKYMGTSPLVYDFPQVAPVINSVLTPSDYAWVGPFEFEENFYLRTRLPSRYHWFLDHAGKIEKIQKEMLADFEKNVPKIIVFKRNYHPWGGTGSEFNGFFTSYLDENYINTADYNRDHPTLMYVWKNQNTDNFNLDTELYLRRVDADALLQKLTERGWVDEKTKNSAPIRDTITL